MKKTMRMMTMKKKLTKNQRRLINSRLPFNAAKREYETGERTMARKRRFGRVRAAFKRSRKPSLSVMDVLLAGAIYGAIRPTVSNMLPTFFRFGPVDSDNLILGAAGYMASRSSTKLIKSIGLIAMGTEAGIITAQLITPAVNGSNSVDTY